MAKILRKTRFLVVRSETSEWLLKASTRTRKYQKNSEGGLIGPHICLCRRWRRGENFVGSCYVKGRLIIFPCMHRSHSTTFVASLVLRLWPVSKGSILHRMVLGWPNLRCQRYVFVEASRFAIFPSHGLFFIVRLLSWCAFSAGLPPQWAWLIRGREPLCHLFLKCGCILCDPLRNIMI